MKLIYSLYLIIQVKKIISMNMYSSKIDFYFFDINMSLDDHHRKHVEAIRVCSCSIILLKQNTLMVLKREQ